MTTQGGRFITVLERTDETDVLLAEDIINRSIAEIGQAIVTGRLYQSTSPTLRTRSHVASGLFLSVVAGQLKFGTGVLFQYTTGFGATVPAPTATDSAYRHGFNLAEANVADPWNGADRWWLLQARVVLNTTLQEIRDIYTPATDTFAPSGGLLDKQYESEIELDWKEGTATTIPTHDAGWAPIAGVWRPAGGGVIAGVDVVNLSIQPSDLCEFDVSASARRICKRFYIQSTLGGVGNPDDEVRFNLAGEVDGLRMFAKNFGGEILRSATFIDPTDIGAIATADVWWYLYLAAPADTMPTGLYASSSTTHRGVLVASRVSPTDMGVNSAQVDLPDPIGGSVAAGDAVFVGVFRASGVGTDIHYIDVSDDGDGIVNKWEFNNNSFAMTSGADAYGSTGSPYNLATTGPGGTEDVPIGVGLKCFAEHTALQVASTAFCVEVVFSLTGDTTTATDRVREFLSCRTHANNKFELKPRVGGLTLTITPTARVESLAASGGGLADGGNNAYIAGIYGIKI